MFCKLPPSSPSYVLICKCCASTAPASLDFTSRSASAGFASRSQQLLPPVALLACIQTSQFAPLPTIWPTRALTQWSVKPSDVFAFCSSAKLRIHSSSFIHAQTSTHAHAQMPSAILSRLGSEWRHRLHVVAPSKSILSHGLSHTEATCSFFVFLCNIGFFIFFFTPSAHSSLRSPGLLPTLHPQK